MSQLLYIFFYLKLEQFYSFRTILLNLINLNIYQSILITLSKYKFMKGIIGAITGDIIGSTREFYPIKTKDFELFTPYSRVTDDSILTLAVANWLCEVAGSGIT